MDSASLAMEMNPFIGQEIEPSEFANGEFANAAPGGSIKRLNGMNARGMKANAQPAELVRAANPYGDVPSLYDM
jgi:hypothetical protein